MKRVLLAFLFLAAATADAAPRPRMASLLPWMSDAFARIPAVELVASVSDGPFTAPKGVIDLGNPHAPNFELLASSRPTVIVGDRRLHGVLREKLARTGAQLVLVEGSSIQGTFSGLMQAAEAAGVQAEMRGLVNQAQGEIAALRLAQPIDVLPIFGTPASFMAVTKDTWLGDLLDELRFRNVAAAAIGNRPFPGYVELSDETLSTFRPKSVLLVAHGAPSVIEEAFRRKAARGGVWRSLAEHLTVLPPELFGRNPGLRIPEAARHLIRIHDARVSP